MPTDASMTTRLVPPYDTRGSGIPVSGATPTTAARLSAAWPQISVVIPTASPLPNGSWQRNAMRSPAQPKAAYAAIRSVAPTSPSSSPMTAKIMSVCASGR